MLEQISNVSSITAGEKGKDIPPYLVLGTSIPRKKVISFLFFLFRSALLMQQTKLNNEQFLIKHLSNKIPSKMQKFRCSHLKLETHITTDSSLYNKLVLPDFFLSFLFFSSSFLRKELFFSLGLQSKK